MTYTVTIDHIDTCLSAYLTDHYNREGEKLLRVPVSRETTCSDVFACLAAEWDHAELREDFDAEVIEDIDQQFKVAFYAMLIDATHKLDRPFDAGLDPAAGHEGREQACAWFLVRYAEDEDEAASGEGA